MGGWADGRMDGWTDGGITGPADWEFEVTLDVFMLYLSLALFSFAMSQLFSLENITGTFFLLLFLFR